MFLSKDFWASLVAGTVRDMKSWVSFAFRIQGDVKRNPWNDFQLNVSKKKKGKREKEDVVVLRRENLPLRRSAPPSDRSRDEIYLREGAWPVPPVYTLRQVRLLYPPISRQI